MSASCSALRRLTPRSSRALQARLPAVSRPSLVALNSLKSANPAAPQVSRFSTMTSQQAAAPAASPDKSYDPEIKGMADYIHKYNVDSDLAVCFR
jgi:2-methylcitrate dehydratase